jgi:hypothetical protein
MLIKDEKQWEEAGSPLLGDSCGYCPDKLTYPIILSQGKSTTAYHAKCALKLATSMLVDLGELVNPLQGDQSPEELSAMARAFRNAARQRHREGNEPGESSNVP